MSKKRGLSLDEKRDRMLEIFYEKKEVFQLKELEKIGPKEKGITAQSVKDVLQSLVDDGKVDTDKIGTSVYFWAFPSKAVNQRRHKLEELQKRSETLKKARTTVEKDLQIAQNSRSQEENRDELFDQLKKAQQHNEELKSKLKQFQEFDPDVLKTIDNESKVAKEAVNRWTDNVFAVKSWCKNKFNMEEKTLNKSFGIPEDLDYL